MNSKISKFLEQNRICCLSVLLSNGMPHSAAMHFVFDSKNSLFVMMTEKSSKKAKPLLSKKYTKASIVVGFDPEAMTTIQLDGKAYIAKGKDLESAQKTYFKKFPSREKYKNDPDSIFIAFKSSWWRWTSYQKSGKDIIYNQK